ncbi:uncharacterized protein GIQ15_03484 [Arthroderma uncinatum]|uniref:uncharacterized protein n=1 Tax=Arthroderma uncinatum TaxID=74035 RepID=UPI00144A6E48|nr:uncharacterized protein GIQ15_03484 [Arthroderma uncinatum]KAF3484160.1 hypothetical protein GIQ15_03484 [Arthroderma uncinatum]
MPLASNIRHQRSQSPAHRSPLSQPPLTSADVAKKKVKKKLDDAARSDHDSTARTDAKTLFDDSTEPSPMSQSPAPSMPPAPAAVDPPSAADSPAFGPLDPYSPSPGEPDLATRTDSWARGIPFGKSPPNDPMDGIGFAESPPAFALPPRVDTYRQASPSTSPPQARLRPTSYAEATPTSTPSSYQPRDRQQRYSISSHRSNRLSYPPPPHLPQAHFYSAPDVDIPGATQQSVKQHQQPGHSFCAVEHLPFASHKSAKTGGNVILVGRDGALDVLAIENSRMKVVGSMQGLNGRVIDATLLHWSSGPDPFASLRPLVAITTHGLAPKDEGSTSPSPSGGSEQIDFLTGTSPKPAVNTKPDVPMAQTRVQIYSLRTRELISTLFATKPVPCIDTFPGITPYIPPPTANLRILASGNLVIIASGTSGEVLVFGVARSPSPAVYQCIGKMWTNVQAREARRYSNSSASTDADDPHSEASRAAKVVDVPILSVSGRWLAVVSPSPNRVSLHGATPPLITSRRIYGVDAHTPPSRPSVTCGVDSGEGESFLNKVARGVTQEVFKGARWIGDQGLQTWNNYWNKDSQTGHSTPLRRPQSTDQHSFAADILPPTHAQETQSPPTNEPDLVSIFDLKPLEDFQDGKSSNPNPIATFQPPHGCSFLSLSPNGLMLITASKKGDIQCIWDLMQIRHCRARAFLAEDPSSTAKSNPPAAHVRQVARYARLTTSTIRDVIWTAPNGEHVAIITKKGTTHVYEVPPSAFRWPPLRRSVSVAQASNAESYTRDEVADDAPRNPFSTAMKLVGDTTQPFLAAMRGRAPSVGAAFTVTKGFAIPSAGGKAVAAGLSKSVGAATETMNNLRYVGENRLHPSNFAKDSIGAKAVWIGDENGKELSIGIMDGGAFKVYQVGKSSASPKNKKQAQPFFGGKILEARLPAEIQNAYTHEQAITRGSDTITGSWSGSSHPRPGGSAKIKLPPLAQAEIETHAPYQPFHTDRRVTLMVYSTESDRTSKSAPWVFGNDIPTLKVYVRSVSRSDDESGPESEGKNKHREMENLISLGQGGAGEHVVITTRRKRGQGAGGDVVDEDGFFEDDCDVLDFARDRV